MHFPERAVGMVDQPDVAVFLGVADGLVFRNLDAAQEHGRDDRDAQHNAGRHQVADFDHITSALPIVCHDAEKHADGGKQDQRVNEIAGRQQVHQDKDHQAAQPGTDHVPEIKLVHLAGKHHEHDTDEHGPDEKGDTEDEIIDAHPEELDRVLADQDGIEGDLLRNHISQGHGGDKGDGAAGKPEIRGFFYSFIDEGKQRPGQAESEQGGGNDQKSEVRPAAHGKHPHDEKFIGD